MFVFFVFLVFTFPGHLKGCFVVSFGSLHFTGPQVTLFENVANLKTKCNQNIKILNESACPAPTPIPLFLNLFCHFFIRLIMCQLSVHILHKMTFILAVL